MTSAKISIVVPFFSRQRLGDVKELLDSIHVQQYDGIETLVIAERLPLFVEEISSYVKEMGYKGVRVLFNQGEWGSYSARNLGIEQASGDIIAFIDDDALLLDGWADETARHYAEDESVIGLTGPILPLWQDESMAWFPREFYWIFSCTYWDWSGKREVRNGYGTNISFRRQAFDIGGVFKNSLEGEEKGKSDWQRPGVKETEFSVRVVTRTGKRIVYNPDIRVKHKVYPYRLSTAFIIRRAYWEGYGKAWLGKLSSSGGSRILATEYRLLRRIFFKLIPNSLRLIFSRPLVAVRRLWITALVLSCVSSGYLVYKLSSLFRRSRYPAKEKQNAF
jgi:glycosyltransferase involved in cell wall biosynthesis